MVIIVECNNDKAFFDNFLRSIGVRPKIKHSGSEYGKIGGYFGVKDIFLKEIKHVRDEVVIGVFDYDSERDFNKRCKELKLLSEYDLEDIELLCQRLLKAL